MAREYAAHAELGFVSLFAKKDADVTNWYDAEINLLDADDAENAD